MKFGSMCFGVLAGLAAAAGGVFAQGAAPGGAGEVAAPPAQETRVIALKHHWTREHLEVAYKVGGVYQPDAMARIDHFFRDWRCNRSIAIDAKLIDLLYDLRQEFGGRTITVLSGYRSEAYNASLLLAGRGVEPNSQHMLGHAADIFIPGVRAEVLRQAALKRGVGGVGYYPFSGPVFVHVDTGPVRQWIETDPKLRRAMRRGTFPRVRLQVDCGLTMATALERVSQSAAAASPETTAAVSVPVPVASPARKPQISARGMARVRQQTAAARRQARKRTSKYVWRRAIRQTPRDFLPQL